MAGATAAGAMPVMTLTIHPAARRLGDVRMRLPMTAYPA